MDLLAIHIRLILKRKNLVMLKLTESLNILITFLDKKNKPADQSRNKPVLVGMKIILRSNIEKLGWNDISVLCNRFDVSRVARKMLNRLCIDLTNQFDRDKILYFFRIPSWIIDNRTKIGKSILNPLNPRQIKRRRLNTIQPPIGVLAVFQ